MSQLHPCFAPCIGTFLNCKTDQTTHDRCSKDIEVFMKHFDHFPHSTTLFHMISHCILLY
eukprot:m.1640942 g.1640942  ORF g.1640942 m.1640942 type:complete len:60 (-) comp44539_c0_seq1:369-548(-)